MYQLLVFSVFCFDLEFTLQRCCKKGNLFVCFWGNPFAHVSKVVGHLLANLLQEVRVFLQPSDKFLQGVLGY
jgi:hypothetical protein